MVNPQFEKHYDFENDVLDTIINIMCHPRKDEARKFLCVINDIMDFYMNRKSNELRMPLLYFPVCEPWAQEICIEFVTLKISLFYNNINQLKLKKDSKGINLPPYSTQKQRNDLKKSLGYKKNVYASIKDISISEHNGQENLLICKPFKESVPKNPYLNAFCGDKKDLGDNALRRIYEDVDEFEKYDENLKFENIFIFLSKSVDGNKDKKAYSYEKTMIEDHSGLKNVFYFYFSMKPFKLQRIYAWKTKNAERIFHKNANKMKDFISLTYEESDYIFGRTQRQTNHIIGTSDEWIDYYKCKEEVDNVVDESCEYPLQVKNELALCFNENSTNLFKKIHKDEIKEFDSKNIKDFFNIIEYIWNNDIWLAIASFMGNETEAAIILDRFIPKSYEELILMQFKSMGLNVVIKDFNALKYEKKENKFVPCNKYKKTIILSYKGHYVGKPYNRYPNSFDPIYLNDEQELLNIIITFALDSHYNAHKYDYYKTLRNVMYSEYRENYVKSIIPLPAPKEASDWKDKYVEYRESRGISKNLQKYNAITNDGKHIKLNELDFIICKENNDYSSTQIISAIDLYSLMENNDSKNPSYFIFKLSDLQNELETIINNKDDNNKVTEMLIRNKQCYALSIDEIKSDEELWRILLRRKVKKNDPHEVYNEIIDKYPNSYGISWNAFQSWYNPDNKMILPRNRKHQDVMFEYLSIEKPYDKIIRKKKVQSGNWTERKNSMLKTFLCNNLFVDDITFAFERLNYDIIDLLSIDKKEDLEALIDLLTNEIKYVEIKSITKL